MDNVNWDICGYLLFFTDASILITICNRFKADVYINFLLPIFVDNGYRFGYLVDILINLDSNPDNNTRT